VSIDGVGKKEKKYITAPLLMIAATFLFATMSMCVKFASSEYSTGELIFYRGLVGTAMIIIFTRVRGGTLRTRLPTLHFRRSMAGVSSLGLWFYSIGGLPLATAVTLNYMSPIWLALILIGGSSFLGDYPADSSPDSKRVDMRLVLAVLVGFAGVVCILQPTVNRDQLWSALLGLLSGLLAALAYLHMAALGRAGEPEDRVVFYFSVGSIVAGALLTSLISEWHAHTPKGFGVVLAVGVLATLAQLLMTRAYRMGGVLANSSLQYLGIGWSYIYGVLLFDDAVTVMALLGMGLIVAAGIFATMLRQSVSTAVQANVPTEP
jgi:S-adenosylmethionine uptake transporter